METKFLVYGIIALVITLFIAYSVITGTFARRLKIHLFILSMTVFAWLFIDLLLRNLPAEYILVLGKSRFVFLSFLPSSLMALIYRFYYSRAKKLQYWFYLPALICSAIIIYTDLFIALAIPIGYRITYQGAFYWLLELWIFTPFLATIWMLAVNRNNTRVITKTHTKTLLYTLSLYTFLLYFSFLIIPYLAHSYVLEPFVKILSALYMFFIFHTLFQRHPLDPVILFKKILVNLIMYGLIFLTIATNIIFLSEKYSDKFNILDSILLIITVSIMILLYMPVKNLLVKLADMVIRIKGYDYYGAISAISDEVKNYRDIDDLSKFVVRAIRNKMRLTKASMYMFDYDRYDYFCISHSGKDKWMKDISINNVLINKLQKRRTVIINDEERHYLVDKEKTPEQKVLLKTLDEMGTDAIVPITKDDKLVGFIVLGKKVRGDSFTSEDESMLAALANHLSISIDNTMLFTKAKKTTTRLAKLNELQRNIVYEDERYEIFNKILSDIVSSMDARSGYLLINQNHNNFMLQCVTGNGSLNENKTFSFSEDAYDRLVEEPFYSTNTDEYDNEDFDVYLKSNGVKEYIALPLMDNEKIMGIVVIENKDVRMYIKLIDKAMLVAYVNFLTNLIKNINLYYSANDFRNYSENIIGSIDDIVLTIEPDGNVVSTNTTEESGISVRQNDNIYQVFDGNDEMLSILNDSIQNNEVVNNREISAICNDGKIKFYNVSTQHFDVGDETNTKNVLLVIKDVTEVNKLRQEILQKERQATIANMASVIVHEIRNPLTSVSALVNLMPTQHNDAEYIDLFTSLVPQELDRVNMLMEDLLEFSRSDKVVKKEKISLLPLLQNRKKVLMVKAQEVNVSIDVSGEDKTIIANEGKIIQVFQNIMQNAIQAMPDGGSLKISLGEKIVDILDMSRSMVHISVEDNGQGMPDDVKDNLFKPFFTTKEKGTGLGLALTQKVIEDHGGIIQVESTLGEGTRFDIYFPKG